MLILEIFYSFMKLGLIAYGGGPGMIPLIQSEVVENKEWVSDEDFRTALGVGFSLPGPIAPKLAFWIGLQTAGIWGALVAVVAVLIPSLTILFVLTQFFLGGMGENTYLSGAAKGTGIGVVGLLAYIAYIQAFKVFANDVDGGWLKGIGAHPDWVVLVMLIFGLALWRPTLMIPISMIGAAVYGAFFLR